MEGKAIIIKKRDTDDALTNYLVEYGIPETQIEVHTSITSALAINDQPVELILFQLEGNNNTSVVDAICFRYKMTPVILCAEPHEEKNAAELLQYGAQDYILADDYRSGRYKRTINNAIYRKQFACQMETITGRADMEKRNRQLNEEMQSQKRRLEHILSSINEVVWSCTADTFETIYINDACYDIYGYKPEEIIGNCDLLFGSVHAEDKKNYKAAWRQLLKTGKSVFEYRIEHKDGTLRYIKNEAVLRRDANNEPRFINGFARDVTLQKKQLLKIQSQNEQLQEIAWIQSHKVRGPVATILGLSQLFNAEHADKGNQEVMNYMQTAASKLDLVIRDIVNKSYS